MIMKSKRKEMSKPTEKGNIKMRKEWLRGKHEGILKKVVERKAEKKIYKNGIFEWSERRGRLRD